MVVVVVGKSGPTQTEFGDLLECTVHIGPERIQCYTKKSKDSAIQDHNGVL